MSSEDETTDVQLDISKYEGHSPAPWQVKPVERFPRQQANAVLSGDRRFIAEVMKYRSTTMIDQCKVNAKLIVDAPLLLEEVKRQREKIDALVDALETIAGDLVHVSSGEDVARIAQFADDMSGLI